jgi:DNA-binding transcriptional ArsR family regulator
MKKQAAATRTDDRLDLLFHALADRTRRGIVTRLVTGPASVSELAMPFAMTLPAVSKHIRVLEEAKIVTRKAAGGVRTCALTGSPFKDAAEWIDAIGSFGETRWKASRAIPRTAKQKTTGND